MHVSVCVGANREGKGNRLPTAKHCGTFIVCISFSSDDFHLLFDFEISLNVPTTRNGRPQHIESKTTDHHYYYALHIIALKCKLFPMLSGE